MSDFKQDVFVSIIMASYNKEKYIEDTIQSILSQTEANFELIIVDDQSNDTTVEKIKLFAQKDSRIVFFENSQNRGANFCRNYGLRKAGGKYVIFIDADDLLAADCVQKRLDFANKHPKLNLMVFTMGVFYKRVGDDQRKWSPVSKTPLKDFLQHKLPWSILQPLWKKDFLLELGGFDESFQRLQDVELNTRALLQTNIRYKLIKSEPDCYYRIDEERKNYDSYSFLKRWVDSAIQYCDKFKNLVKKEESTHLLGTLYQTQIEVIHQRKNRHISKEEFKKLTERLSSCSILMTLNATKKLIFTLAIGYNIYLFRVPGLNKLFKHCLLH